MKVYGCMDGEPWTPATLNGGYTTELSTDQAYTQHSYM